MRKTTAFRLFGPRTVDVAAALSVTPSAVSQWPEVLPPTAERAVLAELARRHVPPELWADEASDEPTGGPASGAAAAAATTPANRRFHGVPWSPS